MATNVTGRPFAAKFKGSGEQLADLLATTNGSLAEVVNGTVIRVGANSEPWDMSREWSGREIDGFTTRYTAWTKAWLVSLTSELNSGGKITQFTLTLENGLPEDEVLRSVETYIMLLNLRRTT
jgi:hypothetical protein